MMSHPEHEDPAMRDHDDEAAERAEAERAAKALFESALNGLLDASDNAKAAAGDLLDADPGFELAAELRSAIHHLDLVKSRVAERLGYLDPPIDGRLLRSRIEMRRLWAAAAEVSDDV